MSKEKWKKVMAVGCSHGALVDPIALQAVLKFRHSFKPHTMIHLGDWCDTACFRAGARGTPDESEPLDVAMGLEHLEQLEPDVVLQGNHEDRVYRLATHHNELVRTAAEMTLQLMEKTICKDLKAKLIRYDGNAQGYMLGGYRYMHGTMFNENCARDHSEAYGNTVFAHAHRPALATGRRSDSPMGYCVGWLGDVDKAGYAKTRRSTLGWGQGFVWGYYRGEQSNLWLHKHPRGQSSWILPN
jgi:predicted phosphodiesterase